MDLAMSALRSILLQKSAATKGWQRNCGDSAGLHPLLRAQY
jgi:hypothetical protein